MSGQAFPPTFVLTEMMLSLWVPQALHAAAELGIADAIGSGARPSDEIADAVGAHRGALYRLLRALTVIGVCEEMEDRSFRLTPLGECLRAEGPDTVRSWALLMGSPEIWRVWGRLTDCVRTGEHAWKLEGTDAFTWLQQDPEAGAIFNQAMFEVSRRTARAVAEAYDFSRARTIVDVGGGFGTVLAQILAANPRAKGVVFDLAHCAEGASSLFRERGLSDRAEFQEGDFFRSVTPGADLYLLKSVIHDWDDEKSISILRNCRDAMGETGVLLVVEPVVPDRLEGSRFDNILVASDLNMMVNT
ncbi:MAG TPA: methyltransferase, partial [Vicinamibacteria bacterium]|nr:methyltransferase [Vicinamibacteria bacterium]